MKVTVAIHVHAAQRKAAMPRSRPISIADQRRWPGPGDRPGWGTPTAGLGASPDIPEEAVASLSRHDAITARLHRPVRLRQVHNRSHARRATRRHRAPDLDDAP